MAEASTSFSTDDLLRDLECPVCQEHFQDPRILPCGHTLCFAPCLKGVVGSKNKFSCPECRSEHEVPSGGIQVIPKNVVVARQLSCWTKKTPEKSTVRPCPLCREEDELRSCGHCNRNICMECLMEHLPMHRELLKDRVCEFLGQVDRVTEKEGEEMRKVWEIAEERKSEIDEAVKKAMDLILEKSESMKSVISNSCDNDLAKIADTYKNAKLMRENITQKYREIYADLSSQTDVILPTKLRKISIMLDSDQVSLISEELPSPQSGELQHLYVDVDTSVIDEALKTFLAVIHVMMSEESAEEPSESTSPSPEVRLVLGTNIPHQLQMKDPAALAIDDDSGHIFVADTGNDRIQCFDAAGQLDLAFGSSGPDDAEFSRPCGILVNNRGRIIVADQENHRIKIHGRDGSLIRVFGKYGTENSQFRHPCGLAFDTYERIHVCDLLNRRIQVYTLDGVYITQYELPGRLKPSRISFTENGEIVVMAVGQRVNIFVLDSEYKFLRSWEVPDASMGLAVFGTDYIMVACGGRATLEVYDLMGNHIRGFDVEDIPELGYTRGLAVDNNGHLYVTNGNVVLKIENIDIDAYIF